MSKGIVANFGISQTGVHLISQEIIKTETVSEPVVENALGEIAQFTSKVKEIIDNEIIPEDEAVSVATSEEENDNPGIVQIALSVAGLGILFGAVYGIKQKVDDNSKQISINRDTVRKKLIHPIMGDSPKDILQTRLAKGEITIEEFEKLSKKLR